MTKPGEHTAGLTEDEPFIVQSEHVRGERRSYWIEKRGSRRCVQDFGTAKARAEKRCAELNRAALASATQAKEE